jgi:hypothetical protein
MLAIAPYKAVVSRLVFPTFAATGAPSNRYEQQPYCPIIVNLLNKVELRVGITASRYWLAALEVPAHLHLDGLVARLFIKFPYVRA